MGVDDRIEVKARRRDQSLRGVNFEGVVIRGREEGLGVERIEGQVCDAEFVRRGGRRPEGALVSRGFPL